MLVTNGGYEIMESISISDQSLQIKVSALEAENKALYQVIEQLNSTLQKLISVYIQPDNHREEKKT